MSGGGMSGGGMAASPVDDCASGHGTVGAAAAPPAAHPATNTTSATPAGAPTCHRCSRPGTHLVEHEQGELLCRPCHCQAIAEHVPPAEHVPSAASGAPVQYATRTVTLRQKTAQAAAVPVAEPMRPPSSSSQSRAGAPLTDPGVRNAGGKSERQSPAAKALRSADGHAHKTASALTTAAGDLPHATPAVVAAAPEGEDTYLSHTLGEVSVGGVSRVLDYDDTGGGTLEAPATPRRGQRRRGVDAHAPAGALWQPDRENGSTPQSGPAPKQRKGADGNPTDDCADPHDDAGPPLRRNAPRSTTSTTVPGGESSLGPNTAAGEPSFRLHRLNPGTDGLR